MITFKIAMILIAIVTIGVMGIGVVSFADSGIEKDERAWVINMLNYGNDPTTKIGYECAHGRMNFGC
jgi:hypothetical protein